MRDLTRIFHRRDHDAAFGCNQKHVTVLENERFGRRLEDLGRRGLGRCRWIARLKDCELFGLRGVFVLQMQCGEAGENHQAPSFSPASPHPSTLFRSPHPSRTPKTWRSEAAGEFPASPRSSGWDGRLEVRAGARYSLALAAEGGDSLPPHLGEVPNIYRQANGAHRGGASADSSHRAPDVTKTATENEHFLPIPTRAYSVTEERHSLPFIPIISNQPGRDISQAASGK
jgi:hypothetical protein